MLRFLTLALLLALALPAIAADKEKEKDPARQKAAEKQFEKLEDYLKERRVSHVVEVLAEWGDFADVKQQEDVFGWVVDLLNKEDGFAKVLGSQPFKKIAYRGVKATPEVDESEFPSALLVDEFPRVQPTKIWRRNEVVNSQLIVASKTLVVRPNNDQFSGCVVLTNAAVAEFQEPNHCVVISSGSVKVIRQGGGDPGETPRLVSAETPPVTPSGCPVAFRRPVPHPPLTTSPAVPSPCPGRPAR